METKNLLDVASGRIFARQMARELATEEVAVVAGGDLESRCRLNGTSHIDIDDNAPHEFEVL